MRLPAPRSSGDATLGARDLDVLDREVELDLADVGQRLSGGREHPAPVRVAAEQSALDERRVGDRARDRLGRARRRRAPRAARRASRLRRRRRSRSRAASAARRARRRTAARRRCRASPSTPDAPLAIMNTESLVESWPSTEMRSNERSIAGIEQAIERRRVDARRPSRRSRASSRRTARSSPRPSPARDSRTAPPRERQLEARVLRPAVGRQDRVREVARRSRSATPARPSTPSSTGSRSSPWPITPVEATATRSRWNAEARPRPRSTIASATAIPSLAGRDVRVAAVHDHGAQPRAFRAPRDDHGRGDERVAREARRRDGVVRVADEQAEVELARGLDAARDAGRPEAGRQLVGVQLPNARRPLDPARAEERARRLRAVAVPARCSTQPLRLVQAEHQVQVLDRLPGGALPEVVDRANTSARPVRGSTVAWIRQRFVSRTSRTPGGASASSMKGSPS